MCCHVYVGTSGFNLKTSSTRSVAHAGSVGFPNFQNAKQFMIDVASAFIIGAANVRWVCFVPFSSLCLSNDPVIFQSCVSGRDVSA